MKVQFGTPVLRNHWNLIVDPCFATLAESAYRGRAGIVSRFTSIRTLTFTGYTGFLACYNPSAGASALQVFNDSTVLTSPLTYTDVMPGQAFLLANSEASRVIGFCLDIDYIGTELNRAGMIYAGNVLGDSVDAGVGLVPDSLKQLLPNQVRTPDRQLTQLWFPGVANEEYAPVGITSQAYTGSHNSLALMAEGMPDGIQLRIRQTTVVEWLPLAGVGVAMPSPTSGTNPVGAYEKLHDIAAQTNAFTHSFAEGATSRASAYAKRAGEALIDAAAVGAARYVGNRMIPRNRNYGNLQM